MNRVDTQTLLDYAKFLFEANEDLELFLVGGLAVQGIYSGRIVRKTSDIDILARKNDAEKLVERMRENKYEVFYNKSLEKYSVYKRTDGIHIDLYPGKIGKYPIEKIKNTDIMNGIRVISREDLIGIKLYAYLSSDRGKKKHLIDIYSLLISKERGKKEIKERELDFEYLFGSVFPFVSEITNLSESFIIEKMCEIDEKVLEQFTGREVRLIMKECEALKKFYEKIKIERKTD